MRNQMHHYSKPGVLYAFRSVGKLIILPYVRAGEEQEIAGWNVYDPVWCDGGEKGVLLDIEGNVDVRDLHAVTAYTDSLWERKKGLLVPKGNDNE